MGVSVAFFFVIWCVTLDYYLETFILCLTDTSKKVIIGIYVYPVCTLVCFDFRITDIIEIIFFCLIIKYKNVVCRLCSTY